jgi:ferrochelatase
METSGRATTGILVLNLGGPDSLRAVRPFLFNLFSDREIIRLGPALLQKPLAYLISLLRSGKTREAYELIGGKSPILDITSGQADALEKALNNAGLGVRQPAFKVFVGMRYWRPFIGDTVQKMHEEGIRRVVALSLYPHYSIATTGSALSALQKVLSGYPMEVFRVRSWFDHPLYIDALVESIRRGMGIFRENPGPGTENSEQDVHVLFSAHSLPEKFIEEGDPYVDHIMGTIREITKKIDIPWSLSYQSKSGPVKWLEPSTEEALRKFADQGIKNLLVVPISFVSDHIETLYEIDILYKSMAGKSGIRLVRAGSLNMSPVFIAALRDIVLTAVKEAGWQG